MHTFIAMIITQGLGFLIVFLLLKKFAWQPLLKLMDERRDKIAKGFDDIEKSREELTQLESEYEAKLANIEEEAKTRIRAAIAEGQRLSTEIQEKARRNAEETIEKAKETLDLEVAKAKVEVRDQIVALALTAAEKIIREKLDEPKHRELIIDFIEKTPVAK